MRWLVAISLRNRIVVIALGVLLVVAAVRTLPGTALDVFPEFAPPLVEVPMKSSTRGLVVPDAAVLYDIHGATWVYEDLGGNAYTRRRVEVAQQAGDRAVVSRGISEGAKVVTTGAPELFGTEFGAGH